jgi:hypothetical protein
VYFFSWLTRSHTVHDDFNLLVRRACLSVVDAARDILFQLFFFVLFIAAAFIVVIIIIG